MKPAIPRRAFLYGSVAAPCSLGAATGSRLDALKARLAGVPPGRICFERARLMTESYRRTEGEPEAVRRAKGFLAVMEGMPLGIGEDELIVGNVSSAPRVAYFAPECFDWRGYTPEREYILGDPRFSDWIQIRYRIPEPIAAYWRDKPRAGTVGHYVAGYAKVLSKGFAGIRGEIAAYRRRSSPDARKAAFYDAAELACRAAEVFAARHAGEARRLAKREPDARRRKELETIAAICAKVPAGPAETFHEALQSFWFTHVLLHINSPEWSISPGRFDQYMWPYYRSDIERGRLTRAQAEELLTCLWFKFNEVRINSVDFINYQNLIVGGTDAGGRDATNELSYLCIDVTRRVPYVQPSLSLRWHPGTPPQLLQKAAGLILRGSGRPALFNDTVIVPALEAAGVALEDARDYAIAGCEEPSIPALMFGVIRGGPVNQAACVLQALARFTGRTPAGGFDEVLAAYREELRRASQERVRICTAWKQGKTPRTPHPFASLLFEDCLARALDLDAGGVRYDIRSTTEAGTITAANALLAVKKAVFEDKAASLPELSEALQSNFEGHGKLRAYLVNKVPKFGNDVDEIDLFARQIAEWNDAVLADLSTAGCRLYTGSGSSTAWLRGTTLGATPDGRLKGEALSVSLGPSAGTDRNGPTALLNSVAKLNWRRQVGGGLTAVKLPYTGSQSPTSERVLTGLVRGFFGKGGMGLHFTVVDANMLRAALKEPQKHLDIIVRVGGFSAPFVLLSPDVQKNILERAEQGLGL
jgi:formate C-acetyltransferase